MLKKSIVLILELLGTSNAIIEPLPYIRKSGQLTFDLNVKINKILSEDLRNRSAIFSQVHYWEWEGRALDCHEYKEWESQSVKVMVPSQPGDAFVDWDERKSNTMEEGAKE